MRYVEFLGLPGVGKTSMLQAVRREKEFTRLGIVPLASPRATEAVRRRFRLVVKKNWGQLGLASLIKTVALDSWGFASYKSFPEAYSAVFALLATVPDTGRDRSLLMNYWRIRFESYYSSQQLDEGKTILVDEGLTQTVFSTVMRAIAAEGMSDQVNSRSLGLMERLPPERSVVFLDTPLRLAIERSLRSKGATSVFLSETGNASINRIWHLATQTARRSVSLDTTRSQDDLLQDLLDFLARDNPSPPQSSAVATEVDRK